MNNYDVAVGFEESTVDAWLQQLFALPVVRSKLRGEHLGVEFDVCTPPTVVFAPPSDSDWKDATKNQRTRPTSADNAFQVHIDRIAYEFAFRHTLSAQLYAKSSVSSDGKLQIQVVGFRLSSRVLQFLTGLLKRLLFNTLNTKLAEIPALDLAAIGLSDPTLAIDDGRASLTAKDHGQLSQGPRPSPQGLFAAIGERFLGSRSITRPLQPIEASVTIGNLAISEFQGMLMLGGRVAFASAPTGPGGPSTSADSTPASDG